MPTISEFTPEMLTFELNFFTATFLGPANYLENTNRGGFGVTALNASG